MPGPARLVPYDAGWPVAAERLLAPLRAVLAGGDRVLADHIGSTSVPGLCAKPFLDLQVRVSRLDDWKTRLAALGYVRELGSRPDSPGVHRDGARGSEAVPEWVWAKQPFVRPGPPWPTILHIRLLASPWGRYTVDFRDWLRAHPAERDRYAALKLTLAAEHVAADDYDDYTRAKTAYFDEVQTAFERWAAGRRGSAVS